MAQKKKKNPLLELLINVVIPVLILNKMTKTWGAGSALLVALAFPLLYGGWEFLRDKAINYISLFGLINILATGLLALMELEGIWFAVKEAFFPLILGIFVTVSAFGAKPLIKWMLGESGAMDFDEIEATITERNETENYRKLQKNSTLFFSGSLYLSAILNFVLAIRIFKDIPKTLPKAEQSEILNQQIADMTWMGYVVITIPSLIWMGVLFYYYFKKLSLYTGLPLQSLLKDPK